MSDDLNPPSRKLPTYPSTGTEPRPEEAARVVRYGAMRWVGEFTPRSGLDFHNVRQVIVQTERGIELGELVGTPSHACTCGLRVPRAAMDEYVANSGVEFCRPRAGRILRGATAQDLNEQQHLNAHIREDIRHCAEIVANLGLDMRVVTAEHLLGGERIVFYFTSPARVDFRQLVKELAQRYRTRIEMRQVGARDEARLVADYEVCGREVCCKGFLKKLRPVNMKMAKLQKSTLDPSKVSGRCGRLRCCLRYENQGYEELAAALPRVGARIQTEHGPGVVEDRQVLTQLVSVRLDDGRTFAFPLEELDLDAIPGAPPRVPGERGPLPHGEGGAPEHGDGPAPRVECPVPQADGEPGPARGSNGATPAAEKGASGSATAGAARRRSRRARRGGRSRPSPGTASAFIAEAAEPGTPRSPAPEDPSAEGRGPGEGPPRPPATASQRRRRRRRRANRPDAGGPDGAPHA